MVIKQKSGSTWLANQLLHLLACAIELESFLHVHPFIYIRHNAATNSMHNLLACQRSSDPAIWDFGKSGPETGGLPVCNKQIKGGDILFHVRQTVHYIYVSYFSRQLPHWWSGKQFHFIFEGIGLLQRSPPCECICGVKLSMAPLWIMDRRFFLSCSVSGLLTFSEGSLKALRSSSSSSSIFSGFLGVFFPLESPLPSEFLTKKLYFSTL